MKKEVRPSRRFGGTITVPGDKSIAHRAVLFSILARDKIVVSNFPDNADCRRSLDAARWFGVRVESGNGELTLVPPEDLKISSDAIIDCGNSATTARLLCGIIAGSGLAATLAGDDSLSRRTMKRVVDPLTAMGAEFFAEDNRLPMKIRGGKLLPFEYRSPVASAQVKSALLLAGLASPCSVTIREDIITRDHTEIMLKEIGDGITVREIRPAMVPDPADPRKMKMEMPEPFKKEISLSSQARVDGGTVDIPGDISTAAFFLAGAAISGRTVAVENVGLNPTRTAFLEHLKSIGCSVEIGDRRVVSGEPRGSVKVTGGKLKARRISGEHTVALVDEIPIVSVMAAFADGTTVIRDAGELRFKECDRLAALADNLRRMGVSCGLLEDGLVIEGTGEITGADFKSYGDHRMAMAFSIASLFLVGPSTIDDASVVDISCPGFYGILKQLTA